MIYCIEKCYLKKEDLRPNWMIVNKFGNVLKIHNNKEYLEKVVKEDIQLRRFLDVEVDQKIYARAPKNIPDDLFVVIPFDESQAISTGYLRIVSDDEYKQLFYSHG